MYIVKQIITASMLIFISSLSSKIFKKEQQLVRYHLDIYIIKSYTGMCSHTNRKVQVKVPLLCAYSSIFRRSPLAGPLEDPSASSSKVLVSSFTVSSGSLASLQPRSTASVSHAMLESTGQRMISDTGQVNK